MRGNAVADSKLEFYRHKVAQQRHLRLPAFSTIARHTAPILAILDTPGNSGAERSGFCSHENEDPTARRTKRIIEKIGIQPCDIVFWNFFAAYKARHTQRSVWALHMSELIGILPNLKVAIVFGDHAWRGMRDVELPPTVILIGAPHPSNRSCNANPDAERAIFRAWERAKFCLTKQPSASAA
jgi:hypothetical protein